MTRSSPDSAPPDSAPPDSVGRLLAEAERLLREPRPVHPDEDAHVARAVEALEAAVVRAPGAASRLARRIQAVRALHALRSRRIPDEALDGLYEAIRARTAGATAGDLAWRRAGMSNAFLDAPRSLTRWRRLAMAACALIAVGVGMVVTRQVEVVDPAARSADPAPGVARDPRDGLLRRWQPARADLTGRRGQSWAREVDATLPQTPAGRPMITFTLRPRRSFNAGPLLDVVPARAKTRGNGLEQN